MEKHPLIGTVIAGVYRITRKIGTGSFGEVYSGIDIRDQTPVALKLEPEGIVHSYLEHEYKVYMWLSSQFGFAKIIWYGSDKGYRIMAMELLGVSIEDHFKNHPGNYSLNSVVHLCCQMLERLEMCHKKGIIHRDIKPDNILIGRGRMSRTLFLIDFGLAVISNPGQRFMSIHTREIAGTARYASSNALQGCEQTKIDDLISLGYILVYLLKGELPWQGIECVNNKDKLSKILLRKMGISNTELCKGLPVEFQVYLDHLYSLDPSSEPPYSKMRSMFWNLLEKQNLLYTKPLNWCASHLQSSSSSLISPLLLKEARHPTPDPVSKLLAGHNVRSTFTPGYKRNQNPLFGRLSAPSYNRCESRFEKQK